MADADRGAVRLELAEELGELRLARAEGGHAAGLDVAGVVDRLRQLGSQEDIWRAIREFFKEQARE